MTHNDSFPIFFPKKSEFLAIILLPTKSEFLSIMDGRYLEKICFHGPSRSDGEINWITMVEYLHSL